MANRNWSSGGKIYSMITSPVLIDCNFVVDSTNGNGLGIRSLKGPGVASVFMASTAPASQNPLIPPATGGGGNSINLLTAANFAVLAYAAITGSTGAGSVVTGDMGIYPNNLTSVTNFPPSVDIGTIHAADSAANQGMIDATAAFVAVNALTAGATAISSTLDGQTLTPGAYKEASGTFNLAQSGPGTLTFNGAGTYNIIAASTLGTGAGGLPTFAFTGGATPTNTFINWAVGSSATINIGVSSAGATFYGNVLAQASVTATQAGTIDGRLVALTGAVTLSDTNALNKPAPPAPSTNGSTGVIVVRLQDNYNRLLKGFKAIVSPVSGTPLTSTTAGVASIIVSLGTATLAQWQAVGLPIGIVPAVGVSFVPTTSASIGGSAAIETTAPLGSGITTIETIGDPNLSIAPDPTKNQGFGAQIILQARDYTGADAAPADGSVISLAFLLNNSGNTLQGE
jgi:type VI secretion system secreted protein VgrG